MKAFTYVLAILFSIVVAACGGGGGSTTSSATVSGVVASGAPLANGAGYALDAVSGNTLPFSTNASGVYILDFSAYNGPFLLHVIGITSAGSPVNMYSIALKSDSGTKINITPLTDAVLGYASGVSTQSLEATCTSNLAGCPALLNSVHTNLASANTNIVAALDSTLDLNATYSIDPNTFNVFSSTFDAGTHTTIDALLDSITVTPAPGASAGAYTVSLVGSSTNLVTLPTSGTVGTTGGALVTGTAPTVTEKSQAENIAAILPEVQNAITALQNAANSVSYSAFSTALTPLLDTTYLDSALNKTAFLNATAAADTIRLGATITGGGIAAYSAAPLSGLTPDASVAYDGNNCVTSIWVNVFIDGNHRVSELLDTGYDPSTCLGGSWTFAGNQRQFMSNIIARNFNMVINGTTPFTKPTMALDIPNSQVPAYTSVVISGPGFVTHGAQATPSSVTLIPTAANLNLYNTILEQYYGAANANLYTNGTEGSDSLVSCAWIGSNPNGWGPSTAATPCFNGEAVAGRDYTIKFYNGATLVETDMERLHVTPSTTIPASWYPTVTNVTPSCTNIPVTGATVTVNWALPTGAHTNGLFLNLNDTNWNTVNNTWDFNLGANSTSASLNVGSMFSNATPSNCVASIAIIINDTSAVTIKSF